jgi:hypothetical protein
MQVRKIEYKNKPLKIKWLLVIIVLIL